MVPALVLATDQHQFEPALPDDAAAEPLEHRPAFAAISRVGFGAGGFAPVRIGGLLPQAHQVEHVDRTRAITLPELREYVPGWIDMAHAGSLSLDTFDRSFAAVLTKLRRVPPYLLIAR